MVTKIEGLGEQVRVLNDEAIRVDSELLTHLERPGQYEITNIAGVATAIQEYAAEKTKLGLPLSLKPENLLDHGETVFLRVTEDNTGINVTNYRDSSLSDQ